MSGTEVTLFERSVQDQKSNTYLLTCFGKLKQSAFSAKEEEQKRKTGGVRLERHMNNPYSQ